MENSHPVFLQQIPQTQSPSGTTSTSNDGLEHDQDQDHNHNHSHNQHHSDIKPDVQTSSTSIPSTNNKLVLH